MKLYRSRILFTVIFLTVTLLTAIFPSGLAAQGGPLPLPEEGELEAAELRQKKQIMTDALNLPPSDFREEIIRAFQKIDRHPFGGEIFREIAYDPVSIPLGIGSLLPSPGDLATALYGLRLEPESDLLIIGGDTGYCAALASRICRRVYVIESRQEELERYRLLYAEMGINNVVFADLFRRDFFRGEGPFPAILVHGALESIPEDLTDQLALNGTLVFALSSDMDWQLLIGFKRSIGGDRVEALGEVTFPGLSGL